MNSLNYEITYYNSPFYEELIQQLIEVSNHKKNILSKVRTNEDLHQRLMYDEKELLKHFAERENQILLKIIEHKGWFNNYK
jgi:GTP1/Obg family GTP-binding protein